MRIDKVETKVYPFAELSDEAKETAVENLSDINIHYEWWDSIFEDAEQIGIKLTEFDIDRGSFCRGDFILDAENAAQKIQLGHGADCETYKTACAFLADIDGLDEDSIEYEEIEAEFKRSILEDYRIILQKDYEYSSSEKAIIEAIEANEYEFTENGKIF